MIPIKFGVWSCLAGAWDVLADSNINIDDFDPQVMYRGPWGRVGVSILSVLSTSD